MLGIFSGKKEEYNKLILKSLLYGDKRTKEISQYIVANSKERRKKVASVRSVISRKSDYPNRMGRLQELTKKEYIKRRSNRNWTLTEKGFAVALTLQKNVNDIVPLYRDELNRKEAKEYIERFVNGIFNIPFFSIIFREAEKKDSKDAAEGVIQLFKSEEFYESTKKVTVEFITKGVDLDSMKEKEFISLWISRVIQDLVTGKFRTWGFDKNN